MSVVLPISNVIKQAKKKLRFRPLEPITTGTEVRYDTTGTPGETEMDKTKHNRNVIVANAAFQHTWYMIRLTII